MRTLPLLLLPTLLLIAGCGPDLSSHEGLGEARLDLTEEAIGILEGITDVDSAKAARPKLEALSGRFEELAKAAKELSTPSLEEAKRLTDKYAGRSAELRKRMIAATTKLSDEAQKTLGDWMRGIR